jgi:predicted amidohydrolase
MLDHVQLLQRDNDILFSTIDLDEVADTRNRLPISQAYRNDIYECIYKGKTNEEL